MITLLMNNTRFLPASAITAIRNPSASLLMKWCATVSPVSYTHLDVYKRQDFQSTGIFYRYACQLTQRRRRAVIFHDNAIQQAGRSTTRAYFTSFP